MASETTSKRASEMTGMRLIIESPRFGTHGHRFIVAPSVRDESLVAQRVEAARRNPRGADGIAVSRSVEQRLESGAVRQGYETILLSGFDTQRLSKQEFEHLQADLEARWPRVDELVAELTPVANRQRGLLLRHPHMQDWADEFQKKFNLRPVEPPQPKKKTLPLAVGAMAVGAMIALLLAIVLVQVLIKDNDAVQSLFAKIREQERNQTLEEAGPDSMTQKDDSGSSLYESLFVDFDDEKQKVLEQILETRSSGDNSNPSQEAVALRKDLYEFVKKYKDLSRNAKGLRESIERDTISHDPVFFELICTIGDRYSSISALSEPKPPTTPMFDIQDEQILEVVKHLLNDMQKLFNDIDVNDFEEDESRDLRTAFGSVHEIQLDGDMHNKLQVFSQEFDTIEDALREVGFGTLPNRIEFNGDSDYKPDDLYPDLFDVLQSLKTVVEPKRSRQ